MRILVAGAAGFIGSHVVERFLAEGHTVLGIDSLISGRLGNLAGATGHPGFDFIEHDLVEPLQVSGSFDRILHLASPASPPRYMEVPIETLRANSEGTYNLLELAHRTNAVFLLASTSEVYGDPEIHPQPEAYWGNVNPIGPRSVYDVSKRFAEAMTMAYRRRHGVRTRITRIFNTYGPRMDPWDGRVVTNLVRQALTGEPLTVFGDGRQTRSFQYVDDLVEGMVRLLDVDHGGPVNLGNPTEHTVLELARMVQELTGSRSTIVHEPLPEDDPRQRRPDITLARRLLDWEPRVPIRDGLLRVIPAIEEELSRRDRSA